MINQASKLLKVFYFVFCYRRWSSFYLKNPKIYRKKPIVSGMRLTRDLIFSIERLKRQLFCVLSNWMTFWPFTISSFHLPRKPEPSFLRNFTEQSLNILRNSHQGLWLSKTIQLSNSQDAYCRQLEIQIFFLLLLLRNECFLLEK